MVAPPIAGRMTSVRRVFLTRAWIYAWVVAIGFGAFAYSFHKVGALQGWYGRWWWFQIAAHYFSAAGVALLLARVGLDLRLRGPRLVAFVVGLTAVGALGWEVAEYLALFPKLHFWGVDDMLIDLAADSAGILTVLALLRTGLRRVIDPRTETPTLSELAPGGGERDAG